VSRLSRTVTFVEWVSFGISSADEAGPETCTKDNKHSDPVWQWETSVAFGAAMGGLVALVHRYASKGLNVFLSPLSPVCVFQSSVLNLVFPLLRTSLAGNLKHGHAAAVLIGVLVILNFLNGLHTGCSKWRSTSHRVIDYRYEHGRILVSARCVTFSNADSLSSNETRVHPGITS
jgi:hypothetical protein